MTPETLREVAGWMMGSGLESARRDAKVLYAAADAWEAEGLARSLVEFAFSEAMKRLEAAEKVVDAAKKLIEWWTDDGHVITENEAEDELAAALAGEETK